MPTATACFRISTRPARSLLTAVLRTLPEFTGEPIDVSFLPDLTASGGELHSARGTGIPVHAGSRMRRREMVLDSALIRDRNELIRIFIHEVHHFTWVRLGNPRRGRFEQLLQDEMAAHARGELGWSAEEMKQRLSKADRRQRSRRWRDYVCESFCDTAAWVYSPARRHDEWTLAKAYRTKRDTCLRGLFAGRPVAV